MNNELEIWNNDENNENNYNNINFDELFLSIYCIYFNINNYMNQKKNTSPTEKENISKKIFYNNLMKIIPLLSNLKNSKCIYDKINHLFNKDNIIFALKYYSETIKYTEKNGQNK